MHCIVITVIIPGLVEEPGLCCNPDTPKQEESQPSIDASMPGLSVPSAGHPASFLFSSSSRSLLWLSLRHPLLLLLLSSSSHPPPSYPVSHPPPLLYNLQSTLSALLCHHPSPADPLVQRAQRLNPVRQPTLLPSSHFIRLPHPFFHPIITPFCARRPSPSRSDFRPRISYFSVTAPAKTRDPSRLGLHPAKSPMGN